MFPRESNQEHLTFKAGALDYSVNLTIDQLRFQLLHWLDILINSTRMTTYALYQKLCTLLHIISK